MPSELHHTRRFKLALLCLLVIQNTAAILLGRYTRTSFNYDINHMLLMAEMLKLFVSMVLELFSASLRAPVSKFVTHTKCGSITRALSAFRGSLRVHIWDNPFDACKLAIPSCLYYLQNFLGFYSVSIIPVPLALIAQQTKLVPTALFSIMVFKRKYSFIQLCSIVSICAGSSICVVSSTRDSSAETFSFSSGRSVSIIVYGVMLVFLSNLCSSIAGVYFEVVIKGVGKQPYQPLPTVWMRNIQLASITIAILSFRIFNSNERVEPFFYDFTPMVWSQIIIFAIGGLFVASVVKHTDSVQKGLANGMSVLTSAIMSMIIEPDAFALTWRFTCGGVLALCGCFFFGNPDRFHLGLVKSLLSIRWIPFAMSVSFLKLQYPSVGLYYTIDSFEASRGSEIRGSELPIWWRELLHVHVLTHGDRQDCGGCMVLQELADSILEHNVSVSRRDGCPTDSQLATATSANKTIVIVYPEVEKGTCGGDGNRVHVRWILAPLGIHTPLHLYRQWGQDDLVFHFGTGCAVHPSLLPLSNILQVITTPKPGDHFDVPQSVINGTNRSGTLWTTRKANKFHSNITFIHKTLPEPHQALSSPNANDFLSVVYFVSYDPYTFYSYSAAMMGAISIVHPIAGLGKREWAERSYVGEYMKHTGQDLPGIAYGWDALEIGYANRTKSLLHDFMTNVCYWGKDFTVERFLKDSFRHGIGDTNLESALLVTEAFQKWYDEQGNINMTMFHEAES